MAYPVVRSGGDQIRETRRRVAFSSSHIPSATLPDIVCVASGPDGRMEMAAEIPEVIQRYQDAHDRHDVEGALAAFSAEATVHDEGQQWRGKTEIRNWLNKTSSEYTFTRIHLGVEMAGAGLWEVRNRLTGNFPGNVVDLRYRFALDGDRITNLIIAP